MHSSVCVIVKVKYTTKMLTLKAPRKNASEKWRPLKSSAANKCPTSLTNLNMEANRVDPDHTAPIGAA